MTTAFITPIVVNTNLIAFVEVSSGITFIYIYTFVDFVVVFETFFAGASVTSRSVFANL